jgi:serine O-acetyltransferase
MGLFGQIYKDYRRYRAGGASWFATIFLTQGFWATSVYRIVNWVHKNIQNRIIRKPLIFTCVIAGKCTELITGILIPIHCEIGEGLEIFHFGTTVFPTSGRLGRNCSVAHGVTLGLAGQGEKRGGPVIGDRVYIGPQSVIVGKVTIGDDVLVSPGAVVLKSVPPKAVVLGNPARVVSYEGSFDYIKYDGMDTDPDRIKSLSLPIANHADRGAAKQDSLNGSEMHVRNESSSGR